MKGSRGGCAADTTSRDVVALAGVSDGNLLLLGIGLALTVPLVVWVALEMFFGDEAFQDLVAGTLTGWGWLIKPAGTAIFVLVVWLWSRRKQSKGAA